MRLMVGVGRERDQQREKCLSFSVKRLLLFYEDVGCWNNFFFGFFCSGIVFEGLSGGGGGCEKKVHTLKGQGAHFLNCFLLVHIPFFPSSSII